jgi:hypothetical protein
LTRGEFRLQSIEPGIAVDVEAAGEGAAVNAEVSGNGLAWTATVGHGRDLEPITQCALGGGSEESVKIVGVGRRQRNPPRRTCSRSRKQAGGSDCGSAVWVSLGSVTR